MKHYKNIHTGEEVNLDTPEKIERFFDNRCPSDWTEVLPLGDIMGMLYKITDKVL